MSSTFARLRNLSFIGYIFKFGGMWGYMTQKYTSDIQRNGTIIHQSTLLVWGLFVAIGSTMIVIALRNKNLTRHIRVADILITFLLLGIALSAFLPLFVQEVTFFLIALLYFSYYFTYIHRHASEL